MSRRSQAQDGRIRGWLIALLLALTLVAAVVEVRYGWLRERLGPEATPADPASVAAPSGVDLPRGLELPHLARPDPLSAPLAESDQVSRRRIRLALLPMMTDRSLGRHVVIAVAPLGSDRPTFQYGSGSATPASTNKLLTSAAALDTLGPDHRFSTRVVRGRTKHEVVLVGGGDPFLASRPSRNDAYPQRADIVTLARRTARELRHDRVTTVRLGYDDSLFAPPTAPPQWEPGYLPEGVVAPITALWVDEGRPPWGYGRVADPSLAAAEAFATALRSAGITVKGTPQHGTAGPRPQVLAAVHSAPLEQIVARTLDVSDNEAAEVLGHHVGLAVEGSGSFRAGAQGVRSALTDLGVDMTGTRLYDGSGLSREDRLTASALLGVFAAAADPAHPELRSVITGLPVAGFTGSLSYRYVDVPPEGRGRVRAKTGTLTGVTALAGVTADRDGDLLAFVMIADRIREPQTMRARDVLDWLTAALGACRCAG